MKYTQGTSPGPLSNPSPHDVVLVEVLMFSRCSSIPDVLCSYEMTHWGPGGGTRYIYILELQSCLHDLNWFTDIVVSSCDPFKGVLSYKGGNKRLRDWLTASVWLYVILQHRQWEYYCRAGSKAYELQCGMEIWANVSLIPRPSVHTEGGSGEYIVQNFWTPWNFSSRDLIGQYMSHGTHTHTDAQVTVCTVAPFVSGSVNTKDLLQLELSLHPCQCEQQWSLSRGGTRSRRGGH